MNATFFLVVFLMMQVSVVQALDAVHGDAFSFIADPLAREDTDALLNLKQTNKTLKNQVIAWCKKPHEQSIVDRLLYSACCNDSLGTLKFIAQHHKANITSVMVSNYVYPEMSLESQKQLSAVHPGAVDDMLNPKTSFRDPPSVPALISYIKGGFIVFEATTNGYGKMPLLHAIAIHRVKKSLPVDEDDEYDDRHAIGPCLLHYNTFDATYEAMEILLTNGANPSYNYRWGDVDAIQLVQAGIAKNLLDATEGETLLALLNRYKRMPENRDDVAYPPSTTNS